MTTATQSTKLIFPQEFTAKMMLGKLSKKNPDIKYDIVKVASGHQIVSITQCPDYMPAPKPLAPKFVAPAPKASKAAARAATAIEPTGTIPDEVEGKTAQFAYEYLKETAKWVYFKYTSGNDSVIHKSHLIGWKVSVDPDTGKKWFVGTATLTALQTAKDKWDK